MDPGGTEKHASLQAEEAVIKKGYLRKLKTMKKKFFVLRGDTPEKSARLEYYDTEKKWKSNAAPKKSILLKNCFNITRRLEVRQKNVMALYTHKECLCVVAESEEELADWLTALLELLHPEDALHNSPQPCQLKWQVNIQKRGLGASRNIVGNYTLSLTDKLLKLEKVHTSRLLPHLTSPTDVIEYPLSSIRRCGDSESFFYMEVGRSSVTGAGELWMHTEDPNIAKSMHTTVLIAMSNNLNVKEELDPTSRLRSASATEASKPISMLNRRQTHQGIKPHGLSPSSERSICGGRSCVGLCISPCENQSAAYCAPQNVQESQEVTPMAPQFPVGSGHGSLMTGSSVRERCDSLPSRGNTPSTAGGGNNAPRVPTHPPGIPHRPHSMYIRGISHSPPANSPLSPGSVGPGSTDSAGSSVSIDETDNFSHHTMFVDDPSHANHSRLINSRTPDERSIPEEGLDDALVMWQPEKCLSESLEKNKFQKPPYANTSMEKSFPNFGSGILKDLHYVRKSSIGGMSEVSSPVFVANLGTSPQDQPGYMPMSPASTEPIRVVHSRLGGNSCNHSRTSSLAEDTVTDGVVGGKVEGYVDMEPNKDRATHTMSPAASVSSVGTPLTDTRLSAYHLDKVSSYFGPDDDVGSRPLRAYSVGSRPDHVKKIINRHDIHSFSTDSSRTRAFSCGSKSRNNRDNRILNHGTPPLLSHLHHMLNSITNSKSCSTPVLGSSGLHRHAFNSSHSSTEPLDDLMEMDFSKRSDSLLSVKSKVSTAVAPPPPPITSSNTDGYMDMAPVGSTYGYVEMKPVDTGPPEPVQYKSLVEALRKISVVKPDYDSSENVEMSESSQCQSSATLTDAYVEMSYKNNKSTSGKCRASRIPSLPIAINCINAKEVKNQPASSASPIFSMMPDTTLLQGTPPRMSPGTSPLPYTPSPMSSLKKSKKQQNRRNSAELSTPTSAPPQTIFPFSPGSPVKSYTSKCPLYQPENRFDCVTTVDSNPPSNSHSIERAIVNSFDVSTYIEMSPGRLSTVKELNETCIVKSPVDKNVKQMMNNATKVSSDNKTSVSKSTSHFTQQKSVEDSSSRIKSSNGTQIYSKYQHVPSISPTASLGPRSIDPNCKENEDILSSNPTATKTLLSNPLVKSTANVNQVQVVKKPILVISQTQAVAADFKPIPAYDIEQKTTKSASPKQFESVLNRQLSCYDNKNRASKDDPCDGYEILSAQNGQTQKVSSSRPGSVNNNKGKKEGGSGSRPPSVNSEGSGAKDKSRPSSVSSEIGGTPCSSRPGSVVGEREKLHYVSLDLNPATAVSPRQPPVGGVYSTIDFVKCEELKNSKNLAAKSTN